VVRHERIMAGYSRMTVRVWVEDAEGEHAYIVRADPPPGESIVQSDRAAEWSILRAVHGAGSIPMPAPLWFDETGSELGSPAIVTQMIDGPSLLGAALERDPSEHFAMAGRVCELAVRIHSLDLESLRPRIERPASWDEYIDGRIQEWVDAERAAPNSDPFMRLIARWLAANKPAPVPLTFVHGDFQPANIVLDRDGGHHMIDWELAHVGDPREDLGWLALCGVNQPPWLIADDPQSFYDRYAELMGLPPEAVDAAAIAYFTVLGSTTVYVRIMERLGMLVRGEASSAMLAYMADSVPGMQNVFLNAINAHADAKAGVA
jgi:aminoglycoside phosphotransferase (APT) family kinase protein